MKSTAVCPFCDGDGCCFCDHEGRISIGPKEMTKSVKGLQSIGVKYLKDADRQAGGGLEVWPEMWLHFLDERNVPQKFKDQYS